MSEFKDLDPVQQLNLTIANSCTEQQGIAAMNAGVSEIIKCRRIVENIQLQVAKINRATTPRAAWGHTVKLLNMFDHETGDYIDD